MCPLGAQDLTDDRIRRSDTAGDVCGRSASSPSSGRRPAAPRGRFPGPRRATQGSAGPVRRNQVPIRAHRRQKGVQRLRLGVQDRPRRRRGDLRSTPRPRPVERQSTKCLIIVYFVAAEELSFSAPELAVATHHVLVSGVARASTATTDDPDRPTPRPGLGLCRDRFPSSVPDRPWGSRWRPPTPRHRRDDAPDRGDPRGRPRP